MLATIISITPPHVCRVFNVVTEPHAPETSVGISFYVSRPLSDNYAYAVTG